MLHKGHCIVISNDNYQIAVLKHYALIFVDCPNCDCVEEGAFKGCYILQAFIGNKLKTLGRSSFENCLRLSKINLQHVVIIPKSCFQRCLNLTRLDLPNVEKI